MNIVIYDQDKETAKSLIQIVRELTDYKALISVHNNRFSLLSYLVDGHCIDIDVIFINIDVNNLEGIDIAKRIINKNPHILVVFTSTDYNVTQEIFDINPIYFLHKPYEKKHVDKAIRKAWNHLEKEKCDILSFYSKNGNSILAKYRMNDIFFIESRKREVYVHTDCSCDRFYEKLDSIEKRVNERFIRCHQSFIINSDKIMEADHNHVKLFCGDEIPVSRSRQKAFESKIMHLGCRIKDL